MLKNDGALLDRWERNMWLATVVMCLCCASAALCLWFTRDLIWQLFAWLTVFLAIALLFRSRWIIPCAVLVIVVAVIFTPVKTGGYPAYELEDRAKSGIVGLVLGLCVGLLLDSWSRKRKQQLRPPD